MGSGSSESSALSRLLNPASPGHILLGKEAFDERGNKIVGNIVNKAAASFTPGSSVQRIPAGLYLSGEQTIQAVPTQEKSVTPSSQVQVITPDSLKYLSKVTVAATSLNSYTGRINADGNRSISLSNLGFFPRFFAFLMDTAWDSMEDSAAAIGGFVLRDGNAESGYSTGQLLMIHDYQESSGVYSGYTDLRGLGSVTMSWGDDNLSFRTDNSYFRSSRLYRVVALGF